MTTSLRSKPKPLFSPGDDWNDFWPRYVASCEPAEQITIAKQEVALEAYARFGTLKAAMEACGLTYDAGWIWNLRDKHYWRRRRELAANKHADYLEQMMLARLEDPQGNRGSDVLLMFNLKAKRPDVYRELPVILGSDQSKDVLDKLSKLAAQAMAARITVEKAPETVEGQVRDMLGPGSPAIASASAGKPIQ